MKRCLIVCAIRNSLALYPTRFRWNKVIVLQLQTRLPALYPTRFRWNYVSRSCISRVIIRFISHTVQMKLTDCFSIVNASRGFISHTVQMKLNQVVYPFGKLFYFISHTVQMKRERKSRA